MILVLDVSFSIVFLLGSLRPYIIFANNTQYLLYLQLKSYDIFICISYCLFN